MNVTKQVFLSKMTATSAVVAITYNGERITGTISKHQYKQLCEQYALDQSKINALRNLYSFQKQYIKAQCENTIAELDAKLDALAGSNAAPVAKPIAVVAPVEPEPKIIKATPKLAGLAALMAVPMADKVEVDTSEVMSAADARKMFAKCLPTSADTTTPDAETNTIADQNAEELRSFA